MIDATLTSTGSQQRLAARRQLLPGGVTAAARWDDPYPIVFTRARGAHLEDVDGNRYLDFHGGLGTAILGYSHPAVDGAVADAMADGRTFVGCAHEHEAQLAQRLRALLPEAERIAFCGGGGSDPLAHAARIARAVTGREAIAKVEGGYQGWHSDFAANTLPPATDSDPELPATIASSTGILPAVTDAVLPITANDLASLQRRFDEDGDRIAALFLEPVLHSSGCIPVDDGYLDLARKLCARHGALLVFDEVLSGFRSRVGGAAVPSGVVPDLAAYGKAIANGHAFSLLAGRAELMERLSPVGDVFFSGTFNASPIGVAAADAVLTELQTTDAMPRAIALTDQLASGLNAAIAARGLNAVCQSHGSVFTLYFHATRVRDARDLAATVARGAEATNAALRLHLRERGIFIQRRPATNRGFVSAAHTEADITMALQVFDSFLDANTGELPR